MNWNEGATKRAVPKLVVEWRKECTFCVYDPNFM